MMIQNRDGLPDAIVEERRFFELYANDKAATPKGWNTPENWKYLDDIPDDKMFGFAIGNGTNYLFIDGDHVRDPETGKLIPWVKEVCSRITKAAATYYEISMSGSGFHMVADLGDFAENYGRESNGYDQIIIQMDPDDYKKLSKEEQDKIPKIEFWYHTDGRYAVLTGNHNKLIQVAKNEDAASIFSELLEVRKEFHAKYAKRAILDDAKIKIDEATKSRIMEALPYISATSRETWIHVGLALYNCGFPFEVWDTWSQFADQLASELCDKYDPAETPKIWKSFANTKSHWNAGTIITLAQENGYSAKDKGESKPSGVQPDASKSKKQKKAAPQLKFVNASDLVRADLPKTYYAIDGLAPEGCTIVAAPPKSGKSWMMLQMCLAVAEGKKFLDFPTHKSDVVYFALEDGDRFEKDRLLTICKADEVPDNFHFVFENVVPIDEGFLDQLEQTRTAYPNVRFVVIDTLKFVASKQQRQETAYERDYRTGQTLKKWADQYGIALVTVTHTRKLVQPDDALANVSGTNGLTGAADAVLVIAKEKRTSTDAVLAVDGRRVRQAEHEISIDWNKCMWEYIGLADPDERDRKLYERKIEELKNSTAYKAVLCLADRNIDGWEGGARKLVTDAAEYGLFITDSPKEVGGMLTNNIVQFAQDGVRVQVIKNGSGANQYRISSWVKV